MQQALDLHPYAFRIADSLVRCKAHHAPALPLHDRRSPGIGFDLKRMMIAIVCCLVVTAFYFSTTIKGWLGP